MRTYKILDLFAGGGGFSTGFLNASHSHAKFEVTKAVEIDDDACNTLISHLGEDKVLKGDITCPLIKKEIVAECKEVDVIIGGPPCQTFSLIGPARSGKREVQDSLKNDSRNTLYRHFFDLVSEIKPRFVVFENVEGLLSKRFEDGLTEKEKMAIEVISEQLEDLGYFTRTIDGQGSGFKTLNSLDYGVSQKRRRVIIIANRHGIYNPIPLKKDLTKEVPTLLSTIGELPVLLPQINTNGMEKLKKIDVVLKNLDKCILSFLNNINELDRIYKNRPEINNEQFRLLKNYLNDSYLVTKNRKHNGLEFLKGFCEDYNKLAKQFNSSSEIPCNMTLHQSRKHNFRDVVIFSMMKQGSTSSGFMNQNSQDFDLLLDQLYPYDKNKHTDTYVKHSWDKPSNTILAHMQKDGLKFIHPNQPRTFTPYEAALIQSFPKNYDFCGGANSQYRQIGNAVPPLMSEAIAQGILMTLLNYDLEISK
ncbi:DNA cytosine methyltransferase [Exiguobacterium sp. s7]|uniref:DNA cytosine methyltransferase n=1 Tax=Exiguobacterium sp. s7 TaxID=2751235 RepID=UPI001BE90812|nr:DNA cytosine methyltransferase [Exiguobacterium sp. s7]